MQTHLRYLCALLDSAPPPWLTHLLPPRCKPPEKELRATEISNLSDAEFEMLFIKILQELSEDPSSIKKT